MIAWFKFVDYRRLNNPLEYEIREEQAASLGRLGRALESSLADLQSFDAELRASTYAATFQRPELVENAAEALWYFIIQREALGLTDHSAVFRIFEVPDEVLRRMGPRTARLESAAKRLQRR